MLRSATLWTLMVSASLLFPSTARPELQLPRDNDASQSRPGEERPPSREEVQMRRSMQKQLTKERYEQMRKDADQLLKLATELKHYVDGAGEHTLSLDVLKKTDEIEKLTKDIRSKMKSE